MAPALKCDTRVVDMLKESQKRKRHTEGQHQSDADAVSSQKEVEA